MMFPEKNIGARAYPHALGYSLTPIIATGASTCFVARRSVGLKRPGISSAFGQAGETKS